MVLADKQHALRTIGCRVGIAVQQNTAIGGTAERGIRERKQIGNETLPVRYVRSAECCLPKIVLRLRTDQEIVI